MNLFTSTRNGQSKSISFCNDQRGLSTVEYVIILVLVAVTGISVWTNFGKAVRDKINTSTGTLSTDVVPQS